MAARPGRLFFLPHRAGTWGRMTLWTRRAALAALTAALAFPAAGQDLRPRLPVAAAAADSTATALEGPAREAALGQANTVLNGVARLQARFLQRAPDGSQSTGTLYLQRPGKLRFEYDPPATMLIISDGNVVALRDRALRTTDRTPLRSTPLNLILRNQVNLARDARIVRVARAGDWLQVSARDRSGQTDGTITLYFYGPNAEFRSWDIVDATGAHTRITLSQVSQPASLDGRLFRLEDIIENRPGPHR